MRIRKNLAGSILALVLAGSLCVPAFSFAADGPDSDTPHKGQWLVADDAGSDAVATGAAGDPTAAATAANAAGTGSMASPSGAAGASASATVAEQEADASAAFAEAMANEAAPAAQADAIGDCTATIRYYENMTYPEPGCPPNEDGRYLMGTRTITGLAEGTVLNAWDYVVDIKGFFFFDGWPGKLTVSSNPDDNVFELIYYREWKSTYTVNYYLMVGADLTASCWSDALAPQGVEFIKFDTETFENQPYGMLVEGDAYEYRLDGKYVVDAYPPEIRVGSDTDNNVLNVLYVPDSTHLPDDFEIPDNIYSAEGDEEGDGNVGSAGTGGTTGNGTSGTTGGNSATGGNGSTGATGGNGSTGATGGNGATGTGGSSTSALPEDQVLSRDEMEGLLPAGMTAQEIDQLFQDFIGSQADAGQLEITDEMLANPVDKEEALARIAAFNAGFEQGKDQAAESVEPVEEASCDHLLCILLIILLLVLAIIGYALFARERKRSSDLREEMEGESPADSGLGAQPTDASDPQAS